MGDLGTTLGEIETAMDTLAGDLENDATEHDIVVVESYLIALQAQLDRLKNIVTSRAPS